MRINPYIKVIKRLASQLPILLVLADLVFEASASSDPEQSQRKLSRGNQLLNAGQLADALTEYHAAIDADNKNYQAYYFRATVYLAMSKARAALPDLNQVINLQPSFLKARLLRGNLLMKMGRFNDAQTDYEAVLAREDHAEAKNKIEEIRPLRRNVNHASALIQQKQFNHAVELLNKVIDSCPFNAEFRELRANALENLGELRKAISDLKPTVILRLDNREAYLKMSVLWYKLGDIEQSLEEVRQCLKLDQEHKLCKAHYKHVKKINKTFLKGKQYMGESDWTEAIKRFEKVLTMEPNVPNLTVEMKLKICECFMKNGEHENAVKSAADVLAVEPDNIPAFITSSDARIQLALYEEAVGDLKKAMQIDDNYPGLKKKLEEAQRMLKQSQKKDYYKILGVPRNARKQEILKSYRKLAREWHPDNFRDEKEKKNAEAKFIDIASAKEVLTDPEKTKIFNKGFDPLDQEDMEKYEAEQHRKNTESIFEQFFGSAEKQKEEKKDPRASVDDLFASFTSNKHKKGEEFFKSNVVRDEQKEEEERVRLEEEARRRREEAIRKQREEQMRRNQEILRQKREQMRLEQLRLEKLRIEKMKQEILAAKKRKRQQEEKLRLEREELLRKKKEAEELEIKKKEQAKKRKARKKKLKKAKKKFTRGTDGKWYFKNHQGRWEVGDPDQEENEDEDQESYTDSNGNVYVKGKDGSWYMRVKTPPKKSSKRSSRNLPQGLFYDENNEVVDKTGNFYKRRVDGKYVKTSSAKKPSLANREQRKAHNIAQNDKNFFRDGEGNMFLKDVHGNLIKVKKNSVESVKEEKVGPSADEIEKERRRKEYLRKQAEFKKHMFNAARFAHEEL